jgi:hypothetical protein
VLNYTATYAWKLGSNKTMNRGYVHVPKLAETCPEGKVSILCNQQVLTDRIIPNTKPDIKIYKNEKGTCVLIDAAISGHKNVIKKEAEKILK